MALVWSEQDIRDQIEVHHKFLGILTDLNSLQLANVEGSLVTLVEMIGEDADKDPRLIELRKRVERQYKAEGGTNELASHDDDDGIIWK